jgi:hypothetical protein
MKGGGLIPYTKRGAYEGDIEVRDVATQPGLVFIDFHQSEAGVQQRAFIFL